MDFVCEMREMQMMRPNKQTGKKGKKERNGVYQCSIAKQKPILATVASAYKYKWMESGSSIVYRLGALFM